MNVQRYAFASLALVVLAHQSQFAAGAQLPCTGGASVPGAVALERVNLGDGDKEACTDAGYKNSSHPTISGDALKVAFESTAEFLDSTVSYGGHISQIYVRDLTTGLTRMASVGRTSTGTLVEANGECGFVVISGDGKKVVFTSGATNLAGADNNNKDDVFVHDLSTRTTSRVSQLSAGGDFTSDSSDVRISDDGNVITFTSAATGLPRATVPGATGPSAFVSNGVPQILVRVGSSTAFEWLSADTSGSAPVGGDMESKHPALSANGRYIAFESNADNLVANDNNSSADVFLCDRATGSRQLITRDGLTGTHSADGPSIRPAVSGDGRYVAFESAADDLLAPTLFPSGDHNNAWDIFVCEVASQTIVRVSVDSSMVESNGNSGYCAISFDGRFVVFTSTACDLVPGDSSPDRDFFVHDRDFDANLVFDQMGGVATRRLSQRTNAPYREANGQCGGNCGISAKGQFAVFNCQADNLLDNVTNFDTNANGCQPYTQVDISGRDIFLATIY